MNKVLSFLGSMKTMAALMLVFAVTIGYATFIENDYGSMTAKADIYNARWFEILLALLAINLTLNIINFKMARKGKWLVFIFHAAFLIILVGAAGAYLKREEITTNSPEFSVLVDELPSEAGFDPDGVGQQVHGGVLHAGFGPQVPGQLPTAGGAVIFGGAEGALHIGHGEDIFLLFHVISPLIPAKLLSV